MIQKLFKDITDLITRKTTGTITIELWSGNITKYLFQENRTERIK